MMRVFITPPINHLELSELGDNNFYILGQLYKRDEKYREYTKKAIEDGRFTILDSGVGDEGEVLTNEELFQLTLEIEPNEVIPLDVLFNKNQTLINFNQFLEWLKEARANGKLLNTTLLACPQGKNWEDWYDCYKFFMWNKYVSCIGMSKKAIPHIMNTDNIAFARSKVVSKLKAYNSLSKPLHFLGQGDPKEFIPYKNEKIFRSTDSCYSILAAINGQDIEKVEKFERIPTPSDYFEKEIKEEQMELIKSNVRYLKKCCNNNV